MPGVPAATSEHARHRVRPAIDVGDFGSRTVSADRVHKAYVRTRQRANGRRDHAAAGSCLQPRHPSRKWQKKRHTPHFTNVIEFNSPVEKEIIELQQRNDEQGTSKAKPKDINQGNNDRSIQLRNDDHPRTKNYEEGCFGETRSTLHRINSLSGSVFSALAIRARTVTVGLRTPRSTPDT